MFRCSLLEKPERRLPQAAQDYAEWTLGRFKGFEALMNRPTTMPPPAAFTVADISVAYALMLLKVVRLFDEAPASLQAYYERLRERPAFRRAKAAQTAAAAEKGVAPIVDVRRDRSR